MRETMNSDNKFLFSKTSFDRSSNVRNNKSKLKYLLSDPNTHHILVWRGKILFDFSSDIPRLCRLNSDDGFWEKHKELNMQQGSFIGFQNNTAIFYHDIPDWNETESSKVSHNSFSDETLNYHPALPAHFSFCELRNLMTIIMETDATILASIKGIYEWNKVHIYCSKCGNKTISTLSGWERKCNSCKTKHFPRIDPAVIMLVYFHDKVLLGRSFSWPTGMYSCLAGFMEPGESIEEAVARETYEEAGIIVKDIRYVTSQPWPFPASLMIGCIAKANSDVIRIDNNELEDARWFTKREVHLAIESKLDWWPAREGSIARFLLRQWIN